MLDTYDQHSQNNPINQSELPEWSELQQAQEYNWELKQKIIKAKIKISDLIELAEQFDNTFLLNKLKEIKL
ncbi:hypothetical protein PHG11b_53 [Flavobacterium phage 11b]|uniref:hypothetical protein n=1 Tax=Flavobacterium phage 11b TaxID=294631 RepID=UPI0000444153|nr:hypothetical protein PHG11b_53 [Flavobacterium phage 11b]CAH56680.1 hypothetical protein PHG11b_53 [Flavobacterium phage 11b]